MIKNVLITVLAVWIVFTLFRPKEEKKQVIAKPVKELVDAEVKRVNNKIDQKGFQHAVIDEVANVVNDKSELNDSTKIKLEEATRLLGIKDKQIEHLLSYNATIKDQMLKAQRTDTSFNYQDQWTNIQYVKPKDSTNNGHFNFSYNAEVNYAEYWERKNIFSKKSHYIDVWISDKRATINGVQRIKIAPKHDKTYVDVNASSMYIDRLLVGADANLHLGRTKVGGGYYYDFLLQKWRPIVSVKVNLLEL